MRSRLSGIDLHDATLEELIVSWATGSCIIRLRCVGDGGGRPLELHWHQLVRVHVDRAQPWGPSVAVLEAGTAPDGTDEIHMQSGDVIRVSAGRRTVVESPDGVADRHASLVVDALVDAGLVAKDGAELAVTIAATELRVRRAMGDL